MTKSNTKADGDFQSEVIQKPVLPGGTDAER